MPKSRLLHVSQLIFGVRAVSVVPALILGLCTLGFATSAFATMAHRADPPPGQEAIEPIETKSGSDPDVSADLDGDVKERITEVQKALNDLRAGKSEDGDRIAVLEARLQLLRRIQDGWQKARDLRSQCDSAKEKRVALEERLKAVQAHDGKVGVSTDVTDAELREQIRTLAQSIDDTEAQHEFVVSSIDFRLRRLQELRELEAKNLQSLATIDDESGQSTVDRKLQLEQLRVEQELIEAERAMYKATNPNLALSRKVLALESGALRGQLAAWQGEMNRRIKSSARQLADNATQAYEDASHAVVRSQAAENRELAKKLEQIHIDQGTTMDRLGAARAQFEDIRRQRMLDEARVVRNPTPEAVAQMRARFTALPDITKITSDIAAEEKLIEMTRDQLDFLDTLSWLSKPSEGAKKALQVDDSLNPEERASRERELANLFQVRQDELIAPLRAALNDRLDMLSRLVALQQSVLTEIRRYRHQVLDRTIWIRDPTATTSANFRIAWEQIGDVFSPEQWREVVGLLVNRIVARPVLFLMGFAPLAFLLGFQRLIRRRIRTAGERVSMPATDSIGETMVVTGFALLSAVAWATPVFMIALFLSSRYNNTPLILSLRDSLVWVWMFLFILGFFWSGLKPDGLAERHFLFSVNKVRRSRLAFVFALLIIPFGILATMCQPGGLDYIPAGRIFFTPIPFLAAGMIWILFHPVRGVFSLTASSSSTAARVWNWIMLGSLVLGTLLLAVIVNLGWYRLVQGFQPSLVLSILLIGGVLLAREYLLRFLRARSGKSDETLDRQQENGQHAARQAEELERLENRTLRSIRFGVVAGILVGLYLVWRGVFPAFAGLDQIVIWSDGVLPLSAIDVVSTESRLVITLGDILRCLAAVIISWYTARNLPSLIELVVVDRFKLERGISYAIAQLLQWAILVFGLIYSASFLDISWSSVQWLAAGLTVGLGFGLQEIFANFISGLIILFERPIRLGDVVTVGGTNGRVSRIRMRSTTISDWDRKELVVPNKKFVTEEIVNWSIGDACIRMVLPIGVSYQEDPTVVAEILRRVSASDPDVLESPVPMVTFERFGDSSLEFELRLYLSSTDNMSRIRTRINTAIKSEFDAAGITIPFPQRDIRVEMVRPDAPDSGPAMPLPGVDDGGERT